MERRARSKPPELELSIKQLVIRHAAFLRYVLNNGHIKTYGRSADRQLDEGKMEDAWYSRKAARDARIRDVLSPEVLKGKVLDVSNKNDAGVRALKDAAAESLPARDGRAQSRALPAGRSFR